MLELLNLFVHARFGLIRVDEHVRDSYIITWVDKKCLSYNFHEWKNATILFHTVSYFESKRMNIAKKGVFSILWNCMISIFSMKENKKNFVSKFCVSPETLTKVFCHKKIQCNSQLPGRYSAFGDFCYEVSFNNFTWNHVTKM